MPPRVLVLTGYGINCDEETEFAFKKAGASPERVHVNDLIDKHRKLGDYQVLAFPGGFSFGDDTGAGNALSGRIRNHLWDELIDFVHQDKLVIGICNGFQVLANLGLVPGLDGIYGERTCALVHNDSARYLDRWVNLKFNGKSPWTAHKVGNMIMPIAHGEGKFYASLEVLQELRKRDLVAAKYFFGSFSKSYDLPGNPNGTLDDIAAITDETGRVLGMMPHPERAIDITQLPNWTMMAEMCRRTKTELPKEYLGIEIFRNAVRYFK